MTCPICKAWAHVLQVRKRADGSRRRRYECANLHRFSTVEDYVGENKRVDRKEFKHETGKPMAV